MGGGRLWEVPVCGFDRKYFRCFAKVVSYGRWSPTGGGRTWRFDCTYVHPLMLVNVTYLGCLPFTWANWSVHDLGNWYPKFRTGTFHPGFAFTICTNRGSCIIWAPLGRVRFGTIGQYVDRLLIAISVDCRLTCCWTLDRYVGQCIGRHISWHVGWHSIACRLGQLSCNIICALKSE